MEPELTTLRPSRFTPLRKNEDVIDGLVRWTRTWTFVSGIILIFTLIFLTPVFFKVPKGWELDNPREVMPRDEISPAEVSGTALSSKEHKGQ
jgi:hypothetical protein